MARCSGLSFLESFSPRGMRFGSRMTAAATTGPASGPLPASSQPATGNSPFFIAYRSRLKVGRTISSPNGRRAAAVRLMAPILARIADRIQFGVCKPVKRGDRELSVKNTAGINRNRLAGHRLGTAHGDDLIGAIVLVGGALEQRGARGIVNLRFGQVR